MTANTSSITSSQHRLPSATDEEGGLQLGQALTAIRRRALLVVGVTVVVASLAQLKAMTEEPVYSAGFEILTKSVTAEREVLEDIGKSQQTANSAATLDATTIRVLQSPNLLNPVVEELQNRYPNLSYWEIIQSLRIQPNGDTILAVGFTHGDPQLVKDVLEAVSRRYLNYSREERQRDILQGLKFVDEQLPALEERVAEQQAQLEQFRQRFNLIDPQSQAQILSGQSGTLAQQLLDTRTQLEQARALYAEIQAELASQSPETAASSAFNQSPRYQRLLDQLLDIDTKLAQESALYREASPEIQLLQEQRQNLVPLLQLEAQRVERGLVSNIRELESRNQAISQSIEEVNQQIKTLSTITRQYTEIQRGLEIATTNLNQFLAQRESLQIEAAQRQIPWQVLTPLGEVTPSAASVKRSLILGAALGSLLGIGAALLLDRISNIIISTKQVKSITRLPVLGVIPVNRNLDNFAAMHQTIQLLQAENAELTFSSKALNLSYSTPFQESFRTLNANLRLLSPDAPIRSIAISSPSPENGKTTISTHLALTAAAMGQRVLVIDTDLRRPQLHQQMGLKNEVGLTDVVSSNVSLLDAVQSIPWEPNVAVLTSGTTPPDPTKILASQKMHNVMKEALAEFDFVIYDTPPLLGLADVYLLSTQTDGLLLVVRLNQLKQTLLQQTMDELQTSKMPVIGTVVNSSEEHMFTAYSYYQPDTDDLSENHSPAWVPSVLAPQTQRLKKLLDTLQKRA